jgi:3-isopropylmalate/(R)-2-methylmalate dehydratase small subunit
MKAVQDDPTTEITIDEGIRHNLINGLDDISITLQEEAAITDYEASRERSGPVTTAL